MKCMANHHPREPNRFAGRSTGASGCLQARSLVPLGVDGQAVVVSPGDESGRGWMFARSTIAALALAGAVPAVAQAPTLEQRVQRMEDESTIRRMLIEYGAFLDAKDYKSYA